MTVICLKSLTREELIETLHRCPQETDKSLEGLDLSGLDLSDLDLSGFNFTKTWLIGCTCRNTKFNGAYFYHSKMGDGIFDGAEFSNAEIIHADFTDASLQKSVFIQAHLHKGTLTDAQAQGANFTYATFDNTVLISTNLEDTILDFAEFIQANLAGTKFLKASTKQTHFINCDLHYIEAEEDLHLSAVIDKDCKSDEETAKSIPPLQSNLLRNSRVSLIPSQRAPNLDSSKAS